MSAKKIGKKSDKMKNKSKLKKIQSAYLTMGVLDFGESLLDECDMLSSVSLDDIKFVDAETDEALEGSKSNNRPTDFGKLQERKSKKTDALFLNDLVNADFLVKAFGDVICFDAQENCWRYFDGLIWKEQTNRKMERIVFELFRERFDDNRGVGEIEKFNIRSCNLSRIKAAMTTAESDVKIMKEKFNMKKEFICAENGVVNLLTGELSSHDAAYLQTKMVHTNYDPDAVSGSRFARFLEEICCNDEELKEYLQLIFGAALLGQAQQQLYFLLGDGANGKSILTESISNVVKEFQYHLPVEELTNTRNKTSAHNAFIVKTRGKHFVFSSELPQNKSLNEGFVKHVTGGSEISARDVGEKAVSFMPEFTVFLDTNTLPPVCGKDTGIRRRLVVVPFNRYFSPEERDLTLAAKLKTSDEQAAIFAWLVEGAVKVAQEPTLVLDYPAVVQSATEEYREQDTRFAEEVAVENFLRDAVTVCEGSKVKASYLHAAFDQYRKKHGYPQVTSTQFGLLVKQHGLISKRSAGNIYYYNIEVAV